MLAVLVLVELAAEDFQHDAVRGGDKAEVVEAGRDKNRVAGMELDVFEEAVRGNDGAVSFHVAQKPELVVSVVVDGLPEGILVEREAVVQADLRAEAVEFHFLDEIVLVLEFQNVQDFFDLKGALLAFGGSSIVVVGAISDVGILRDFGDDQAPADAVNGAGRNDDGLPFLNGVGVDDFLGAAFPDGFLGLFGGDTGLEAS